MAEKKIKYISVQQAVALSGKTKQSISDWCTNGRLLAIRDTTFKRARWMIEKNSLMEVLLELGNDGKQRVDPRREVKTKKQQQLPLDKELVTEISPKKKIILDQIPIDKNSESRKSGDGQKTDIESIESTGTLIHATMSLTEAKTVLQIEKAVEQQRKNLIAAGRIVDMSELSFNIREIFRALFVSQRELIDKWHVDYKIDLKLVNLMRQKYDQHLERAFTKLLQRSGIESTDIKGILQVQ